MKKVLLLLLAAVLALGRRRVRRRPRRGRRLDSGSSSSESSRRRGGDKPPITVGSANFPENVVLAEIYAGALTAKDFETVEEAEHRLARGDLPRPRAGRAHRAAGVQRRAAVLPDEGEVRREGDRRAGRRRSRPSLPDEPDGADAVGRRGQGHDHLQQGDRGQVRPDEHRGPREGRRTRSRSAGRPSSPSARASASRRSSASTAPSSRSSSRSTWPAR